MTLSSKLLLRVLLPVVLLLAGLVALAHKEAERRTRAEARDGLEHVSGYAARLVERSIEAAQDGLLQLARSSAITTWARATDDAARERALLDLERECSRLVDRIPSVRVVRVLDRSGLPLFTSGRVEELPWALRLPAGPGDAQAQGDGVELAWHDEDWAIASCPAREDPASLQLVAAIDLHRLLVEALDFSSRTHPGACLLVTSADGRFVSNPGPACRHTAERIEASSVLVMPPGTLSVHDSELSALVAAIDGDTQVAETGLLVLITLAAIIWLGLRQTVIHPLRRILSTVEAFDAGQDLPPRTTDSRDELGLLETSMRNALRGLLSSQQHLSRLNDTLEARVQDRTQQLGAYAEELRAARDEAQSASAARAEFVTRMSHALRTPLNGILGMTSLLLDMGLDPEQRECVEAASRSGNQLKTLLDDVIHFSHLDRKQVDLEERDFQPRQLLREVRDEVAREAATKGLVVGVEIHPDLPQTVRADVGRIRQVLMHLARNAIEFTDVGEISLRVRPEAGAPGALFLRFEVHDTGRGISPEDRKHLFEPFRNVRPDVPARTSRGLGLPLCSLLAQAMEGRIGVQSHVGRGSTFWFTARAGVAPSEAVAQAPDRDAPRSRPGDRGPGTQADRGLRVLVVEDDAINQKVAARMLERLGYQVVVAGNGLEGLHAFQREHFDAIFMDCEMPVMDGFAATAAIRARSTPGDPVPIIAMTAHAMDGDRERVLAAGMDDYLSKPVTREDLSRTLLRWIPAGGAGTPVEAS